MKNDIDTIALLKYLKNTGWREIKIKNKDIKVFQIEGADKELHQVAIPMDSTFSDYDYAIKTALKEIDGITMKKQCICNKNRAKVKKMALLNKNGKNDQYFPCPKKLQPKR